MRRAVKRRSCYFLGRNADVTFGEECSSCSFSRVLSLGEADEESKVKVYLLLFRKAHHADLLLFENIGSSCCSFRFFHWDRCCTSLLHFSFRKGCFGEEYWVGHLVFLSGFCCTSRRLIRNRRPRTERRTERHPYIHTRSLTRLFHFMYGTLIL